MKVDTTASGSPQTAEAVAVLQENSSSVPPSFVHDLFGRVPQEDLSGYAPQTLARLAAAAYEHLKGPRRIGVPDVHLYDLELERFRSIAAIASFVCSKLERRNGHDLGPRRMAL